MTGSKKRNVVIGVAFGYHDASCCIIEDGKLIASAQEERFTRVKHDFNVPKYAFHYCLEVAGVSVDELLAVAYYEEPYIDTIGAESDFGRWASRTEDSCVCGRKLYE